MVSSLWGSQEGPDSSSLRHACTPLPQHGYTGGPVAPMYNQPSTQSLRSPLTRQPRSICAVSEAVSQQPSSPTALGWIFVSFVSVFVFLSLIRIDAWIVHEHYWLSAGSLGSLSGSITAGTCMFTLMGSSS